MRCSAEGLALIRHFEGFAATPYRCPAGYWTVGYGHVLAPHEPKEPISQAGAIGLLRQDVMRAERSVANLIAIALTQYQFDALVSFTFNLGSGALQRSRLRQAVNRGEHEQAGEEFSRWVYAAGRRLPGLIRRRAAEARLYAGAGFSPLNS